jgi:hypothetical protein
MKNPDYLSSKLSFRYLINMQPFGQISALKAIEA